MYIAPTGSGGTTDSTDDGGLTTYDDPRDYVPDEQEPGSDSWESDNETTEETEPNNVYDDPDEINEDDSTDSGFGLTGGDTIEDSIEDATDSTTSTTDSDDGGLTTTDDSNDSGGSTTTTDDSDDWERQSTPNYPSDPTDEDDDGSVSDPESIPTLPDDDPRLDNMDDSETVETEDGDQAIIGDELFTGNDYSGLFEDTDGDGEPNVPEVFEQAPGPEDVEQAREEVVYYLQNPNADDAGLSDSTKALVAVGGVGVLALAVSQGWV